MTNAGRVKNGRGPPGQVSRLLEAVLEKWPLVLLGPTRVSQMKGVKWNLTLTLYVAREKRTDGLYDGVSLLTAKITALPSGGFFAERVTARNGRIRAGGASSHAYTSFEAAFQALIEQSS